MSFKYKELGECIDLIIDNRGKTPKKMGSDWVEKGIKTISAKNIHNGKLDNYESIRFVNSEVYKKWMKDDIKKGDCLLVSEGATLGENLYWDLDEKVVIGQRLYCIRTNEEILNSKYFSAYLNTVEYQKEIEGRSTGTSVLGIRQTELLKTKVLIMDMEEQKFIGNLYYDINLKIEVNNKINKNLEEMAQAIFKQWFVDFEFPNEEGKPYKSSGGEMVESELGMIPKGWEISKLGNYIELYDSKRIPLSKNEREKREKIYPYYGAASLMDFVDDYIFEGVYILMGEDGTVSDNLGYPILQYVWGKFWVNNHAHVIKGVLDISEEFIYILLKNTNVKQIITGAVQPKINQKNLREVNIVMPVKKDIVKKYSDLVNKMFFKIRILTDENERLEKLRDTLLPKLMSGEIRVPLENNKN
ncbi:MAG: restriction endonuclease subunit S [Clostridium perfringens]|nr:restriction endonuclease subunit S [Clostridium perfringens]